MQEFATDYLNQDGCCLNCLEAQKGCLCPNCKCTKCYWYSSPEQTGLGKGKCDYPEFIKEQRKQEWIAFCNELEEEKFRQSKLLEKDNEKIEAEIKARGEIVSTYTCQKCKRDFVTDQYLKIIPNQEPVCKICGKDIAKINLSLFSDEDIIGAGWTKKEIEELIEEIYRLE